MIQFISFELENFVTFEHLNLDFSTDAERPLTVVRGENETGKTTLMRALQWVIFGSTALPKVELGHPFRPLWANAHEEVITKGTLNFTLDDPGDKSPAVWRIVRSAKTVGFEDSDESLTVLHQLHGEWKPMKAHNLAVVVQRHFPTDTRGFYFVDSDEADAFVGGSESRFDAKHMRKTITQSLHQLLGLKTLLKSADRLDSLANEFNRSASKATGDQEVQDLQEELDKRISERDGFLAKQQDAAKKVDEAQGKVDEYDAALQGLGEQQEEIERLRGERDGFKSDHGRELNTQVQLDADLANSFGNESFFASLMRPLLTATTEQLQPKRADGVLPPHEVSLLPKLLETGECVCSTDFEEEPEKKAHVEERLRVSLEFAKSHEFLNNVLISAERQLGILHQSWTSEISEKLESAQEGQLRVTDAWRDYEFAEEAFDNFVKSTDNSTLQQNMEQRNSWEAIRKQKESDRLQFDNLYTLAVASVRSLTEKQRINEKSNEAVRPLLRQKEAAQNLERAMKDVARKIEEAQVPEVSDSLNHIFLEVIAATEESNFSKVGIEPVTQTAGTEYGLYSRDAQGNEKDLALANGASRRALAVAFVLALTEATQSAVPFIADSLLHALSGTVKINLVKALVDGTRIGQPIIFCTRDDVLDPDVAVIVSKYAGRSYTLTSQPNVGKHAVRYATGITNNKGCSVACGCSITEYCEVCEQENDSVRGLLTERGG